MTPAGGDEDRFAVTFQMVVWYVFFAGLAFVALFRGALSAKYSADSELIRRIAQGMEAVGDDKAYANIGELYRLLGLGDSPTLAGVLGYCVFGLAVLPAARSARARHAGPAELVVAAASLVLAAVYLGVYSKDVVLVAVAALAMAGYRDPLRESLFVGCLLGYAALFRDYWFLVAGAYVALRVLTARRLSVARVAVVAVLTLVALTVAFDVVLGVSVDSFRDAVNVHRVGSADAQTIITPILAGHDLAAEAVNAVLILATLYVPVVLAAQGGAFYLLAAGLILTIWVLVFRSLDRIPADPQRGVPVRRMLCLVFALTFVQAIFEPDYGSYLRHLTPLLPVVLYALLSVRAAATSAEPRTLRIGVAA
jgi:hypothetical protein